MQCPAKLTAMQALKLGGIMRGRTRAQLEERDAEESSRVPEDHLWSEAIPRAQLERELTATFWRDPEPQVVGVLTADRIRAYNYATGRMIRPFQDRHLNAASYDLTLGPRFILDGEEKTFDVKRRMLRIPPGSIAMVTSRELLLMPHWLVATFNLKSRYIFEGLLMGAGPQIDPGYMGVLTCPLHNISNQEIKLKFCEPFAKLDFVKTTWGASIDLGKVRSEDRLYELGEDDRLRSRDGETAKLWPRAENFSPPLSHLAGSKGATSSLHGLKGEFERVKTRVRWGTLGLIGTVIALIAIFAALVALSVNYTNGRVEDVRSDNAAAVRTQVARLLHRADAGSGQAIAGKAGGG